MSVEAEARKALRRVVFYRILAGVCDFPGNLAEDVRLFSRNVSSAVFYLELDAARRYTLITGSDLGVASGHDGRYTGMTPEALSGAKQRLEET